MFEIKPIRSCPELFWLLDTRMQGKKCDKCQDIQIDGYKYQIQNIDVVLLQIKKEGKDKYVHLTHQRAHIGLC